MNKKAIKLALLALSLPVFFLSFANLVQAEATCHRPYCNGSSCEGGYVSDGNAIGCAYAYDLVCTPETDNRQECGAYEEFVYPSYGYEYQYQYEYEYQYPYPAPPEPSCGGQGQACCGSQPYCSGGTVCCTPGSNVCEFQCSGGYGYEYPTPSYGYEYEYPSPAYGYPTPSSYSYQTEYAYPTPEGTFDYTLSNSGNLNVTKSGVNVFANEDITKTLISGTTQSVTLSLSGVPSGVSYSLANGSCSPTCVTTISFTVSPSAPVGTHTITVTGAPLSKTTQFNLIISSAPASSIGVVCTPSDEEIVLGETVTWTGAIEGGTEPYTYSWNGPGIPSSPAPSTNPISIRYSTVGEKTATLTVMDSVGEQGYCTFDGGGAGQSIKLKVNFNPAFEEF